MLWHQEEDGAYKSLHKMQDKDYEVSLSPSLSLSRSRSLAPSLSSVALSLPPPLPSSLPPSLSLALSSSLSLSLSQSLSLHDQRYSSCILYCSTVFLGTSLSLPRLIFFTDCGGTPFDEQQPLAFSLLALFGFVTQQL